MKTKQTAIARAIAKLGGQVLAARMLGVTQQAVSTWVRQGWAPVLRAMELEKLTGIRRRLLVNPRLRELTH